MQATLAEPFNEGPVDEQLRGALQLFGFKQFSRKQEQLIRASIFGRDVLGVLPTGGGKSACFHVPGIVTGAKTLVVSPLIALQDDQVQSLRTRGVKAFALHSDLPGPRRQAVHYYYATAPKGEASFLYLSPEQLLTEAFHSRFDGVGFDRIAVDEAHCVSTWGDAFRPDYQRIRVAVRRLRIPHCSAFTATVDPKIKQDIRRRIPLRPGFLTVEADPMRPNLTLKVEFPASVEDHPVILGRKRFSRLLQLLQEGYVGPVIVYCASRDGAYQAFARMQQEAGRWVARTRGYSTYLYHAGLPYEDKQSVLRGFLNDKRPIVFATTAFGMGVSRPDVRQVIHYQVPPTLIDYAQQIGRAGRDGLPALCTTFCLEGDGFGRQAERAKWGAPTYDFVEVVHRNLVRVLANRTRSEGRKYNIRSFLDYMRLRIENSQVKFKASYLDRVNTAVAILQRAGVISEDGNGLSVSGISPGSKKHDRLIGLTHMRWRMLVREQERLRVFFGNPDQDQSRLWEILRRDEDLDPEKEETALLRE